MEIKLIAIDMDGTLLHTDGVVSQKNRHTLQKAIEAGIYVVPATGRVLSTLPEAVTEISSIKYMITSNGAAVYEKGVPSPIYTNFMSCEKTKEILEKLAPFDTIIEMYVNGQGYFEKRFCQRFQEFHIPSSFQLIYDKKKHPIESLFTVLENAKGVEKLNIPWLKEGVKPRMKKALETIEDIFLTSSLSQNLEINAYGVNKGEGMKALCNKLGITMKNVMAIGDSYNDKELLEAAGISVAMENGEKQIKDSSDFVTLSNDNDGVSYAIEKLCFK